MAERREASEGVAWSNRNRIPLRGFMQESRAHANESLVEVSDIAQIHPGRCTPLNVYHVEIKIERSQDHSLCLSIVAGVASTMSTDLAPPDRDKGTRVAVGAAPCQDIAIGCLHDGKDMSRALVGHCSEVNSRMISCCPVDPRVCHLPN